MTTCDYVKFQTTNWKILDSTKIDNKEQYRLLRMALYYFYIYREIITLGFAYPRNLSYTSACHIKLEVTCYI